MLEHRVVWGGEGSQRERGGGLHRAIFEYNIKTKGNIKGESKLMLLGLVL